MTPNHNTPDYPVSFGRKCSWLAIRGASSHEVAAALRLADIRVSGWEAGIEAAYQGAVFVAPPVGPWVLVVSQNLPYTGDSRHRDECTPFLLKLGERFPEVQFFATHRGTFYCAWARVVNGEMLRQFAWVGSKQWDVGAETPEEQALNLHFEDSRTLELPDDDEAAEELLAKFTPGEEDVLRLAGAWSVDPSMLAQHNLPVGVGFLGQFREA